MEKNNAIKYGKLDKFRKKWHNEIFRQPLDDLIQDSFIRDYVNAL